MHINNFLLPFARATRFPRLSKKAFKAFSRKNINRTEIVETKSGFRMKVSGSDVVANRIWVYKEFEPGLTKILSCIAENTSLAIDVGCNIGYFSCLMKWINDDLKLICVDPVQSVLERCSENLQLNNFDAIMIQCAVGENEGTQDLLIPVNNPCLATLGSSVKVLEEVSKVPVLTKPLERILQENNVDTIDILKMDTEGYDLKILLSLKEKTAANIKNIVCEFSEMRLRQCGSTMKELFEISWLGMFNLHAILDDGSVQKFDILSEWPSGKTETLWLQNKFYL